MTFDDFKTKPMEDQADEKSNGQKAKGTGGGYMCTGTESHCNLVSQVSDLLKQQQANLTHQENILEGQSLAQRQAEEASKESQRELKEMIETLARKLDEKSKEQMELRHQNLNLQEALKRARGTVFAENCILVAFSICQKAANLLTAQ
uniref:Oxidized low density lipoprotein receptor 1 n=1 Tax=Microcebus murinus TaxID=30608 RepID=A0A8C5Y6D2_MICMU